MIFEYDPLHQAMFARIMPHYSMGDTDALFDALKFIHDEQFSAAHLTTIIHAVELWHERWVDAKASLRSATRFATRNYDSSFCREESPHQYAEECTARCIHDCLAHVSWYARQRSLRGNMHPEDRQLVDEAIESLREIAALCGSHKEAVVPFIP